MIDKLKSIGGYIIALILGVVYFLLRKNKGLKDEVAVAKEDQKAVKLEVEEARVDEKANVSTDDYDKLRDEYLRQYYLNNPLSRPADMPAGDRSSGSSIGSQDLPDPDQRSTPSTARDSNR